MIDSDLWFHIPGFNGYQINPYREEIRSMKMMFKDPGHVLKPRSTSNDDYTYELTSDNGKRIRVKYSKLYELTFENEDIKPQQAYQHSTYLGARQKTFTSFHRDSMNDEYSETTTKIDLSRNIVHKYEPISFYD